MLVSTAYSDVSEDVKIGRKLEGAVEKYIFIVSALAQSCPLTSPTAKPLFYAYYVTPLLWKHA